MWMLPDRFSSDEDSKTTMIIVELIYLTIFYLISPFMVFYIRKWWVSLLFHESGQDSSIWDLRKLNSKPKALNPKELYIGFLVGLSHLSLN